MSKNLSLFKATTDDAKEILKLLKSHKWSKYLKQRTFNHIYANIKDFIIVRIKGILVWNIELINIDNETIELGAFAISKDLDYDIKNKVWEILIMFALQSSVIKGKKLISLTNNSKLQSWYLKYWLIESDVSDFSERKNQSPGVSLFIYSKSPISHTYSSIPLNWSHIWLASHADR